MPAPGKRWYHIVINSRGSWLTGDPRGFRSRHHRLHSSGDYKSPPPQGEHADLHQLIRRQSRPPVRFPCDLLTDIGQALIDKARSQACRVLAVAVDAHHAHLLAELPSDRAMVKRMVGQWKQHASHRVRERLPGEIWAKSCDPKPINDLAHQRAVYRYILGHKGQGAWVWSFREGPDASSRCSSASA